MAKAGLSFADPFFDKVGVGPAPNPYAPLSPTSGIGVGNLGQSAADMALLGERMVGGTQFTLPEMRQPPDIGVSESTGELFVQGRRFPVQDAATALEVEGLLGQPGRGELPTGFVPLDEQAYGQYLQSIRSPSLGRLASKSFGRGVDISQMLAGRGLQLAGAEELGGRIVSAQEEQLRQTSPFERQFTDIESGRGAVEWFVANFAQQGPNMIESVITAGLGFLAGTAAGGPIAGAGGALAGLMGKTAFKESVKAAAKKKVAGETLSDAENKLLREAAGLAGAVSASYAQNITTGASDIYGELRESGADADDIDARIKALAGSLPYAALETLPEFLLASRILSGVGAPRAIPAGTSVGRRGAELLRRGLVGGAVGGLAEGTTEASQEALLLGISEQDLTSDEGVNRLINSFAAGFGVGGPIGAAANLRGREPANLLDPGKTTEPPASTAIVPFTPPQAPPGPGTGFTMVPGTGIIPQPVGEFIPAGTGVAPPLALPAPRRVLEVQGRPGFVVDSQGNVRPADADDVIVGVTENIPPVFPGQQGVLDIFGGEPVTAGEIATRMQPPAAAPEAVAPSATPTLNVIPGQGALQFGPAAPEVAPLSAFGQQIAQVSGQLQRQREFEAAQQQRAEQEAAQREADFNRALAQQQLQLGQVGAAAAPTGVVPALPPRQFGPTEPQQLSLFGPRGLPRPSGAERLRRGATPLPETGPTVPVTPRESLQVAGQLPLFTREGQPSVAALRSAGKRRKVRPQLQRGGRQRPSEPAAKVRAVAEKVRKRQRVDTTFDNGDQFVGIIDNEGNLISGKYSYANGDVFEGTFQENAPYNGDIVYADKSEAKYVKGEPTLTKEAPSAVQKRGAEKVPAREPAETGAGVGEKVSGKRETATKGEALKKGEQKPPVRETGKKVEETKRPKAEAALAAYATPEEAWEDLGPDDVKYSDLPDEFRAVWDEKFQNNQRSLTQAYAIGLAREAAAERQTVRDILEEEISVAETSSDLRTFRDAISTVLFHALFDTESNNRKTGVIERAQSFFANTQFSPQQQAAIDAEVMALTNERLSLEAVFTRGGMKGQYTPIFSYLRGRALLPNVTSRIVGLPVEEAKLLVEAGEIKLTQLPEDTVGKITKMATTVGRPSVGEKITNLNKTTSLTSIVRTPQAILANFLDELFKNYRLIRGLNSEMEVEGKKYPGLAAAAKALYSRLDEAGRNYFYRGKRLKDFFNENGEPNLLKSQGRYVIVPEVITAERQAEIDRLAREEARMAAEERAKEREERLEEFSRTKADKEAFPVEDDYDKPDGMFYRDDGTDIGKAIPAGRVKILVTNFLRKLRIKPRTFIYRNVEDLKRSNPELYAQAAAARPQGDFDTTQAMGYSFGGKPAATTGVSRREFFKGFAAVIAAGKANLQGMNKKELWDEMYRLESDFFEKLQETDFRLSRNVEKYLRQSKVAGAKLGAKLDDGSLDDVLNFAYDVFEETGSVDQFPNITSDDVSGYRAEIKNALKFAEQAAEKTEAKPAAKEVPPTVIIFSDFIRSERQLKFVMAHETLGHFGFKGVMSKAELDSALNNIYETDSDARAAVDEMMAARGMPKLEALEEYVADFAAEIDVSILNRIWNALKNALNKIGLKFEDDAARYLVNLARKYVRRGDTGNFLSAKTIAQDFETINSAQYEGRYAVFSNADLGSKAFAANAMNYRYGPMGGLMGAMQAFKDRVFGTQKDVPGTVARILEEVQTLDNKARRSEGLSLIYKMFERQQQFARSLLSKYQRMTSYSHTPDYGVFGEITGVPGVTEQEKEKAGELLAYAALLRGTEATDELIRSFDSLVYMDNMGNITVDPKIREKLEKAGYVSAEQFREGFQVTLSNGNKVKYQFDVDEDSDIWKVYNEMRAAVNESAIDLMLSNFEASQAEGKRVVNRLNDIRRGSNVFTDDDLTAIRKAAETYKRMRYAGQDVASAAVALDKDALKRSEEFVIAFGRALFNDKVYKVWMKEADADPKIVEDLKEFQKAEYDDLRAALPSIRQKITGSKEAKEGQSFAVQKSIRDLFMFDLQSKNADYYAKRTILGSYVPFTRRGTEQVRLTAYDAKGNPVRLDEAVRATLPYFQFDSRSEALKTAEDLEKEFGGDNEWTLLGEDNREVTVRLRPEVSRVRQSSDLTEAVNFNEFIYVLNRLNVNVTPEVRERIVTTLTNQNERARKNLQRSGTPGWDKDVIRSVSEHLETNSHVAAKKLFKHRLDDILLNNNLWLGDPQKLASLKAAVDTARNDLERARAQREYDQYAYMYRYMRATAGENTVEIDGKEVPTLGRGEDYREEAKQVLRWYAETGNIVDSTEDMLSGETGSTLKMATVLMQLGGSVATAFINLASLVSNSVPYLAFYNPKTGVGGGYGFSKATTQISRAIGDVGNFRFADGEFIQDLLSKGNYDQYGLTQDEAEFLFQQTEEGTLQAAQFNALVGTARGKVFSNRAQAAIKAWMSMFSYTEQMNRRTTALATYRLEKERLLAEGITDQKRIEREAAEAARTAVNTSQGEYAMFNRPEMARGNVLQYVFMYKQFVIITVQLLRNMPVEGRLLMLGFLLLVSGIKGLPFAEDLMDVLDTILQKLGLRTASVEKQLAEWIDAVAPGLTPYAMRGILDRTTGSTLSTRLSLGDMLPLTGAFRAGASPIRELENFAGPVVGGIGGLIGMAGGLAKYGAETVGLRDDTTSLNSLLRESPIALLRAVGDGSAYLSDGRITNTRGQVVAEDVGTHVALARFLGFYPAIATQQNDIVRLSKYVSDYAKAIKADYTAAYVKARLAGDTDAMQKTVENVRNWNEAAAGTGLEISNFVRSANRAAREAERPTALRFLKAAPKNVRAETLQLLEIYGIEPGELQ
jgi:hypothetical protein